MTLFEFGRLLYRNASYLIIIPVSIALLVFVLTINQKKHYASSALIYTGIASGFNIESGAADKVDYHAVNNAFDNMISIVESKQTIEEVLLRMLAKHIYGIQQGMFIPIIYQDYISSKLTSNQQKLYYHNTGSDSTYIQLNDALKANDPLLIDIIRGESGLYNKELLSTLEVKRHKSSDMLKLYYTAEEPIICKQVVELVIHVFSQRYRAIKVAETGDVVAYFQAQLNLSKIKLNKAEDRLTDFRTGKRVINYGEQTKAIAIKKQNALEEYSNKKMNLLATQVALNDIESKLKIREDLLSKNTELLDKRNRLAELVQKLAKSQSSNNKTSRMSMKQEIKDLKVAIQKDLEVVFSFTNSKEGLPSRQLLNEWLEHVIALNREKVNVQYYKKRLNELDALYENFAPLGSTLARLEREISVSEREYLEILNGLNMSKLRQQNIQLSSQLETVDNPQLPTQALPSKRKLLVVIGFVFGIVSVISFLVAQELLDNTLSTPSKAEKATKLELIGAFPIINEKFKDQFPNLLNRIKSLSITKIINDDNSSKLITVFSAYDRDGKKTIADMLAKELREAGFEANIIQPSIDNESTSEGIQSYTVDSKLNQIRSIKELNVNELQGYTILVLPALTDGRIPYELIKTSSKCIMIARADKVWSVAQSKAIKDWKKKTGVKPYLILNGAKTFNLEEFIGDVNTQHSYLIKKLRKVARFEFKHSAFSTL